MLTTQYVIYFSYIFPHFTRHSHLHVEQTHKVFPAAINSYRSCYSKQTPLLRRTFLQERSSLQTEKLLIFLPFIRNFNETKKPNGVPTESQGFQSIYKTFYRRNNARTTPLWSYAIFFGRLRATIRTEYQGWSKISFSQFSGKFDRGLKFLLLMNKTGFYHSDSLYLLDRETRISTNLTSYFKFILQMDVIFEV